MIAFSVVQRPESEWLVELSKDMVSHPSLPRATLLCSDTVRDTLLLLWAQSEQVLLRLSR